MTPSTDNIAPPKDTEGGSKRIEAIVDGINKTSSRIQAAVAQGPSPGIAAPPTPAPPETPPAPPAAEPADTIVDPPKDAAPGPDAAIESLDAQLAELTAELLDSRSATPGQAPDPQPAQDLSAFPTASAPQPSTSPAATTAPASTPARPAPAPAAPAVPAAPASTPTPAAIAPAPPTTPVQAPASPPAKPTPNRAAPAKAAAPSRLLSTVAILSKPLANKPPIVRNAAGLLAINSLLLGAGVWAFVALRHPPVRPVEQDYDFSSAKLPAPPPEKQVEAAPADKEGAEHSEGHEGAEAKPKSTKKPPAKTPSKTDKKAGAKKPPPKTEEHE